MEKTTLNMQKQLKIYPKYQKFQEITKAPKQDTRKRQKFKSKNLEKIPFNSLKLTKN